MEQFINDRGDAVTIVEMDKWRLVHSIAKYSNYSNYPNSEKIVKALKAEAIRRIIIGESKE